MARYNIYKVKVGLTGSLQSHLTDERHYVQTGSFSSAGYHIYVYFSDVQPTEIWWLKQYSFYFDGHATKQNQIYSGAIIAKKDGTDSGYVIPLGKTHFFIQDFVDLSFGLELAERIADEQQTKMKSLKAFGGKTSKSLVSYNSESKLIFGSCESAEYLKLKVVDKEKWGNSYIHFGTSVQFNCSETEPENLGALFSDINAALTSARKFRLPLMKEVDSATAAGLFATLAQKILALDSTISFLDYELYGVDFVFSQQTHVRLKFGNAVSENLSDLTLDDIVAFAQTNNMDLAESLPGIKVQTMVDGDSKYTLQLIRMIEYYDDVSRTFLFRGKWFQFNESFIDVLHTALDKISTSRFQMNFSEEEFRVWVTASTDKARYRERFIINKISELLHYVILDRALDYLHTGNKKYSIEISDLYDAANERAIVVKIGEPHDFSYAFDQAQALLSTIEGHTYKTSDGTTYPIKEVELLLVFRTGRELATAKDTKSLIFELKLNELQKLAQEKDVQLKLSYSTVL